MGIVERAFEQGEERRSGEDRREATAPPPPPKGTPFLVPLFVILAGLVVTAATYNFADLKHRFEEHETIASKETESFHLFVQAMDNRVSRLESESNEAKAQRSELIRLMRTLARKQGIKVEEDR